MMRFVVDGITVEMKSVIFTKDPASRPLANVTFDLDGPGLSGSLTVHLEDSEFETAGVTPQGIATRRMRNMFRVDA
jgi:hypothetical protein